MPLTVNFYAASYFKGTAGEILQTQETYTALASVPGNGGMKH